MPRIASFDIGKRNFAQYVEDFSQKDCDKIREMYNKLPKRLQGKLKVIPNEVQPIIHELCLCGNRVAAGVYDLSNPNTTDLDIITRNNIIQHLLRFQDLWDTCDYIIIEQQYYNAFLQGKRKRKDGCGANIDAIKIAELVMTYFLIHNPNSIIKSFNSMYKTHTLGASQEDNKTKPKRKAWAIQKAREIYTQRRDEDMIKIFNPIKKRGTPTHKLDDLADTLIQCIAAKYKYLILKMD